MELLPGAVSAEDHVAFPERLEKDADALLGTVTVREMVLRIVVVHVDLSVMLEDGPVPNGKAVKLEAAVNWPLGSGSSAGEPYAGGP